MSETLQRFHHVGMSFSDEQKAQIKAYVEGKVMSEERGGIIRIDRKIWHEILDDVLKVDSTDTQGVLRDKGAFAEVHKRLLLPETYTVHNIFYEWLPRTWNIIVEGPDLPLAIEGQELPRLTPWYQRNADGSNSLVRIDG
jgi:hypothetical protein